MKGNLVFYNLTQEVSHKIYLINLKKFNNISSTFFPINKCNEVLTNYLKLNNLFCKGTGEIMINQELKEKRKPPVLFKPNSFKNLS